MHTIQVYNKWQWQPGKKDESLFWPPLISDRKDDEEDDPRDFDDIPESDDDLDPSGQQQWTRQSTLRHSEDEGTDSADLLQQGSSSGRLKDPVLAKSYIRLESAPFIHCKQQSAGGKDKWHEWLAMQKEWLNNAEENPDYFDDNL